MVVSKSDFADAVYVDLSELFSLQENSAAVVAVVSIRVTLEADNKPWWLRTIFLYIYF